MYGRLLSGPGESEGSPGDRRYIYIYIKKLKKINKKIIIIIRGVGMSTRCEESTQKLCNQQNAHQVPAKRELPCGGGVSTRA